MLKQKSCLQVKIDDRIYELQCAPETQLGELHDVVTQMKQYIVQRINEAANAESQNAKEKDLGAVVPEILEG